MMVDLIVLLVWIVFGVFAYGLTLNYFTNSFPYMRHRGVAWFAALGGPFGFLAIGGNIFADNKNFGLRFRPIPYEERYQIFKAEYGPWLDRAYFDKRHK